MTCFEALSLFSLSVAKRFSRPFFQSVIFLFLLNVVAANAQDLAGLEQGIKPYGSYEGGDIDSISMVNGSLTLHMPLISYPQRGGKLNVGFSLMYANPILQPWGICNPSTKVCTETGYNLNYGAPRGTSVTYAYAINAVADFFPLVGAIASPGSSGCQGIQYYTAVESDGATHEIGPVGSIPGAQFLSVDTTGYRFVPGSSTECYLGVLTDRQGNIYNVNANGFPTTIQDANGNFVTTNTNSQGTVTGWTDTLGRVVAAPFPGTSTTNLTDCPATATGASVWSPPEPNGSTLPYKFCWASINISFTPPDCTSAHFNCQPTSATSTQMVGLVLPNSTAWTFAYDNFGEVTSITFPTGGSISYTWTYTYGPCVASQYVDINSGVNTALWPYRRAITSRTVTDATGLHTWTYASSAAQTNGTLLISNTSLQTIVTAPPVNGVANDTVHTETPLGSTCSMYETETDEWSGSHTSGTELQTVATAYNYSSNSYISAAFGDVAINVLPAKITTTNWISGKTSQVTKTYDAGIVDSTYIGNILYGDLLTETDSDFGTNGSPGGLLRQTINQYMALSGPNANYYLYNNLLSLPYTVQVENGGGTQVAYTTYGYDETSLQTSNVTEQKTTGESYPGNQTSVHRWLNGSTVSQSPCSVSVSNGYLVSTNVFYDTGELQQSTDPCGYWTHYQYSPTYYGAYPTTVTNVLGQSTNYLYDSNLGSVTSIEDPNSQTTTKSYDPMNRLIQVNYPDGGSTSYCYTDGVTTACPTGNAGSAPFAVVETKLITSSTSEVSTATVDGLGRLSQTQLNSDPSGTTYALTTYDPVGRKSQVYNPTRCSSITSNCDSETTWGVTTYTYDPLNRVTSVAEQDGSVVNTAYDQTNTNNTGVCTTVTDEAGNSRQLCVDGLGRMTGVWEAPSGLNYETDYAYDALNNLLTVTQQGNSKTNERTRTFTYDSLSHLTSAKNPESGTISYSYDADGNVVTKTAPLPNQPLATSTVTTAYTYDKLNRLLTKSYNDGKTAMAQFGYDAATLMNCTTTPPSNPDTYPIGRRTSMCDGSGATAWTHDTMGRVLHERRTIGAVSGDYENDAYNLAGLPTSLTTLGYSVAYTYSKAGRALTAINYSGSGNYQYVSGATYAPPGELASTTLGATSTFTGIVTNNAYNDRLQPILLSAAVAGQSPVFSVCFNFNLGIAINTAPCSFSASTVGDNGNVIQIVNNRTNYSGRSENFMYDSLNRIQQAYSTGSGSLSWGETYGPTATSPGWAPTTPGIDAWGNLWARSGVTRKTYFESMSCPANTNNQLTTCSYGYDAAGNMTSNGTVSYVYDAENRLIAVAGDATPTSYVYDGDGKRVEKCTEGSTPGSCATGATGTLYWRGTSSDALSETNLSGTVQNTYVFFNGQRVARLDSAGAVHYYFSDHLGTHAVVENATATTCEQDIDYYPYGGVEYDYCSGSGVTQNYKFTGKERDSESGLDMFGARYYGSSLGRFMTPDWETKPTDVPYASFGNPQSLNLYSYVNNNPTTTRDPDGHCPDGCPTPEQLAAGNQFSQNVFVGAAKGLWNMVAGTWNTGAELLNAQTAESSPTGTPFGVPTLPMAQPANVTQAVSGAVAQTAVVVGTAVADSGAASRAAGESPSSAVPQEIPAGPSARPTAAQQSAINEMGEAHGCSTCGATTPGTKSGNWVGDHQPPTALNKDSGPQVYKPQCLQCSRQQGGQVAAAVRAAKKQDQPQQ